MYFRSLTQSDPVGPLGVHGRLDGGLRCARLRKFISVQGVDGADPRRHCRHALFFYGIMEWLA